MSFRPGNGERLSGHSRGNLAHLLGASLLLCLEAYDFLLDAFEPYELGVHELRSYICAEAEHVAWIVQMLCRLRTDESERLLLLTDLAADVKQMVMRSGRAEGFDAGRWLGGWLQQPCPALAGAYPAEYLDTMEGCRLIRSLLSKMETGVYA